MLENCARYPIAYGKNTIEFIDKADSVIFYARATKPRVLPNPDTLIAQALCAPIGAPPLETLVKPGNTVALIVDDITRPTPRKPLLRAIAERLERVRDVRIFIVLALGTHRPMTKAEIEEDLGEFARRYPILNISYTQKHRFVQIGVMPDGTPIQVYREILEADVLVGVGNIVPHIAAGWGGGAKIIMPGVCSKETTDGIHVLSCLHQNVLETCGSVDNLFRRTVEELAEKVGLTFIVNTVIDEARNILGVFSGHFKEAHRAGVAFARSALCPRITARADILIVSANPAHADFWQGAKPYVYAHFAVKRGGVMILLLEAPEGLCGGAPAHEATLRRYYDKSESEIRLAIASGEATDILGLGEAFIRLQTEGFCHTILVSEGLNEDDSRLLGFEKAPDLDAALLRAKVRMGLNATIGIIPQGGDLLCVEG